MKKPPRAAYAPTRELYACTASLLNGSIAQDGAAWVRYMRATGPELDFAVGMSTDRVVDEVLAGIETSFRDCVAAGETPAARQRLADRLVGHIHLAEMVLVDQDGFDRPCLNEVLGRLAFYALALGRCEVRQYAHDHALELARMAPPGDVMHYMAHGLGLLTDQHPCFQPVSFTKGGLCIATSHAFALGLEHMAASEPAATAAAAPLDEEERLDLEEDRSGIVRWRQGPPPPRPRPKVEPVAKAAEPTPEAQGPGVVVFPADVAQAAGKGENRREIERFLGKTLGARLPLVPVPEDWNAWEATLNGESPWLAPFHRAVRLSQGGRSHWGGGVICVEGPPGAGKSRGVRRVAEVSGLPYARVNLEATSDNAGLGGTSIRYLSAHASALEGLIATSGKASVCLALDECEKAGGGRKGGTGDPHDLLHGWFEAETARAWRSTYLLSPIDISHTLFLCTANETTSVPGSLRDRMSVIRVGGPLPEHVGVLAPALAREACRELGQDERFGLLDADEMSVLANAWSQGGSIRRLAKLVRAVLDARETGLAAMPRH
ncbi:AAA family ATPase [Methylobacterium komagatae]